MSFCVALRAFGKRDSASAKTIIENALYAIESCAERTKMP
jgi:hypothetical protein